MSEPSTAVATRKPSNFELTLEEYAPQWAAVLPSHISLDLFKRVIITAVNGNPDLVSADRRSFFVACQKCAQDGLLPDGREAVLNVYSTKVKRNGREEWIKAAQYLPMVYGIKKRMRNTGEILSIDGYAVFANDEFDYELGDNPFIRHKPTMGDPGEVIASYSIIKLTNGEIIRDVLPRAKIERARAQSKQPNGMLWAKFYDEAAIKTAIKHASKSAPTSSTLERLLSHIGDPDAPQPQQVAPPPRPMRAEYTNGAASPADIEYADAVETGTFTGDIANEVATEHDADGVVHDPAATTAGDPPASGPASPEAASPAPETNPGNGSRFEDDDKARKDWVAWGTKQTEAITFAKTIAELDKVEAVIRKGKRMEDYDFYCQGKSLMLLQALTLRRTELTQAAKPA